MITKKKLAAFTILISMSILASWGMSQTIAFQTQSAQSDSSIQHQTCSLCIATNDTTQNHSPHDFCSGCVHSQSCSGCQAKTHRNNEGWKQLSELPQLDSLATDNKKGE